MSKYVHKYQAFGRLVLNSAFMSREMRARASKVAAEFRATAPVETGEYKSSAKVSSGKHGGEHLDRAYGRVDVDDPAAMSIEFGHIDGFDTFVEGSHTLTRALDAAGDG